MKKILIKPQRKPKKIVRHIKLLSKTYLIVCLLGAVGLSVYYIYSDINFYDTRPKTEFCIYNGNSDDSYALSHNETCTIHWFFIFYFMSFLSFKILMNFYYLYVFFIFVTSVIFLKVTKKRTKRVSKFW